MIPARPPALRHSLSRRVLGLTLLVTLLTEALLFVPAITRDRRDWLDQRIIAAQLAAQTLPGSNLGFGGRNMSQATRDDLLRLAGVVSIRLQEPGRPMVELSAHGPVQAAAVLDLRRETALQGVARSLKALARRGDRLVLVMAQSPKQPSSLLSVVLRQGELDRYLRAQAGTVALSGLVIALVAGLLVFVLLEWLLVRPMRRLIGSIVAFRADPERTPPLDAAAVTPMTRDEMAVAASELAAMQRELRAALWRNARLAALGTAVAKVSHDLRGALSPALLAAERLQAHADPAIVRTGDMLARAVERATALVGATLDFARDAPPPPARTRARLGRMVEEAADHAVAVNRAVRVESTLADDLVVFADPAGLVRALGNLLRNAAQAGARRITVAEGARTATTVEVIVSDDGPGLPEEVRGALFRPFLSGGRPGGSGLGLAITRDLLRAQGGDVAVLSSGASGTAFRLTLMLHAEAAKPAAAPVGAGTGPDV
jgi:signal transduction histidine kinase